MLQSILASLPLRTLNSLLSPQGDGILLNEISPLLSGNRIHKDLTISSLFLVFGNILLSGLVSLSSTYLRNCEDFKWIDRPIEDSLSTWPYSSITFDYRDCSTRWESVRSGEGKYEAPFDISIDSKSPSCDIFYSRSLDRHYIDWGGYNLQYHPQHTHEPVGDIYIQASATSTHRLRLYLSAPLQSSLSLDCCNHISTSTSTFQLDEFCESENMEAIGISQLYIRYMPGFNARNQKLDQRSKFRHHSNHLAHEQPRRFSGPGSYRHACIPHIGTFASVYRLDISWSKATTSQSGDGYPVLDKEAWSNYIWDIPGRESAWGTGCIWQCV